MGCIESAATSRAAALAPVSDSRKVEAAGYRPNKKKPDAVQNAFYISYNQTPEILEKIIIFELQLRIFLSSRDGKMCWKEPCKKVFLDHHHLESISDFVGYCAASQAILLFLTEGTVKRAAIWLEIIVAIGNGRPVIPIVVDGLGEKTFKYENAMKYLKDENVLENLAMDEGNRKNMEILENDHGLRLEENHVKAIRGFFEKSIIGKMVFNSLLTNEELFKNICTSASERIRNNTIKPRKSLIPSASPEEMREKARLLKKEAEEAAKRIEEEQRRLREEEEERARQEERKQQELEEMERKLAEEKRRQEEEMERLAREEAEQRAREEEIRRQEQEEAQRRLAEEKKKKQEELARRQREEEAARAAEEERRQIELQELERKRKEEKRKKKMEDAARRQREENQAKLEQARLEELARARREEEERERQLEEQRRAKQLAAERRAQQERERQRQQEIQRREEEMLQLRKKEQELQERRKREKAEKERRDREALRRQLDLERQHNEQVRSPLFMSRLYEEGNRQSNPNPFSYTYHDNVRTSQTRSNLFGPGSRGLFVNTPVGKHCELVAGEAPVELSYHDHPLVRVRVLQNNFRWCDICGVYFAKDELALHCKEHGFDVCKNCELQDQKPATFGGLFGGGRSGRSYSWFHDYDEDDDEL